MRNKIYPVLVLSYETESAFLLILESLEKRKLKILYTPQPIKTINHQTKFICFSNLITLHKAARFIKKRIQPDTIQTIGITNFYISGIMKDRVFIFDKQSDPTLIPLKNQLGVKIIATFKNGTFRSEPKCPTLLKSTSGITFFNDLYRILYLEQK